MNMKAINEDLKEMLSFRETLALVCFNINYSRRYEVLTIQKLSQLLGIESARLEKACRILTRIGMAKLYYIKEKVMVEMTDPVDAVVKNTVFEVINEKQMEYSTIYKGMVQEELYFNL